MSFDKVRTRIAPSPTGNLHLGTVRTALYNMLYAKKHNGEFLFRLEDTDQERSKEEFTQEIIDGFKWIGLGWDGEMLRQSEKQSRHEECIQQLIDEAKAYKCYATPEELEEMRKELRAAKKPEGYDNRGRDLSSEQISAYETEGRKYVIRLNLGEERDIKWLDLVRGPMSINSRDLGGDPVIQKFNGQVLYNFAVVIDDHDMKISHVFRGEDHLTNTAKQIAVFEALNFPVPEYGHLPLIFTTDKQKLSKRKHGDIAGIAKYQREGYLPAALANYLIATSYTAQIEKDGKLEASEQELYTLPEASENFRIEGISKSPAIYDIKKLNWFNSEYIKGLDFPNLMTQLKPFLNYELNKYSAADQELLIENIRGNLDKFEDINEHISYFFEDISHSELPDKMKEFLTQGQNVLKELIKRYDEFDFTDHAAMKDLINKIGESLELKGKNLFFPIRLATSARSGGPDLGVIFYLLGKETIKNRIEQSISLFSAV